MVALFCVWITTTPTERRCFDLSCLERTQAYCTACVLSRLCPPLKRVLRLLLASFALLFGAFTWFSRFYSFTSDTAVRPCHAMHAIQCMLQCRLLWPRTNVLGFEALRFSVSICWMSGRRIDPGACPWCLVALFWLSVCSRVLIKASRQFQGRAVINRTSCISRKKTVSFP